MATVKLLFKIYFLTQIFKHSFQDDTNSIVMNTCSDLGIQQPKNQSDCTGYKIPSGEFCCYLSVNFNHGVASTCIVSNTNDEEMVKKAKTAIESIGYHAIIDCEGNFPKFYFLKVPLLIILGIYLDDIFFL